MADETTQTDSTLEAETRPDSEKLVKFGTIDKMFQKFAALMPEGPLTAAVQYTALPGGLAYTSIASPVGEALVLPTNEPTRTGYTFAGWYTEQEGGELVDGTVVEDTSEATYFAHWTPNTYTVTLDPNWGTEATTTTTVTYNSPVNIVTVPTRDKYAFAGYYDAETDGTKYFNADGTAARIWDKAANTTLYARWTATDPSLKLVYDEISGQYTNDSIVEWINSYADGLVYGVQVPLYSASTATTATKTDANAGLILEPSTDTVAGRNDYLGKKLFMCQRVNGGVRSDGMMYVTAIEGIDSRFNCKTENTFVLTPIYYVKYTETDEYVWYQYTDTAKDGFLPCQGSKDADGNMRPYILRACYLSGSGFTSKSGIYPTSTTISSQFNSSKDRSIDQLTYLSYADVTYRDEFKQLMLGTKDVYRYPAGNMRRANPNYYGNASKITAVSSSYITIGNSKKDNLKIGGAVNIGTYESSGAVNSDQAVAARITNIVESGSSLRLYLDCGTSGITTSGYVYQSTYKNGSCDNILGTYGAYDEAGLIDGLTPYRFQNMEYGNIPYEAPINAYWSGSSNVMATTNIGNVSNPTTSTSGWTTVSQSLPPRVSDSSNAQYIGDVKTMGGVRVPATYPATSTTGCRLRYYASTSYGSGALSRYESTFDSNNQPVSAYMTVNGNYINTNHSMRISTIGRSSN